MPADFDLYYAFVLSVAGQVLQQLLLQSWHLQTSMHMSLAL